MSKVGKFLKNNIKLFVGIIIGGILFGGATYVVATEIASSSVTYTGNGQSTVEGAINDLYGKADTWIDPSTIQTNSTGKIFASSKGIIIRRNGQTHLIRSNNWNVEKDHIQQIFSDVGAYNSSTRLGCYVNSNYVTCNASDFTSYVDSNGNVEYHDNSDYSTCGVNGNGSVYCD